MHLPWPWPRPIFKVMRVACDSCSAAYEVPDHLLGSRPRLLRCARCGAEWTVSAEPPLPTAEAVPEEAILAPPQAAPAAPEAAPTALSARRPHALSIAVPSAAHDRESRAATLQRLAERKRNLGPAVRPGPGTPAAAWLGWVGTIVLLGVLAWSGYAYRTEVMHVWPPSQRLYSLLGVPAPR